MAIEPPYSLLAELTHACPLRCAYCSNPIDLRAGNDELATADWIRVVEEAAELGVLQFHLSGGEPLIRKDLEAIVTAARRQGLYTNLITSGIPLSAERMHGLAEAGLNSVQISIQDSDDRSMKEVVGMSALSAKISACTYVNQCQLPLSINIVLHRHNIARFEELVLLAVNTGATRIELAHVQFYGWAFRNRNYLMPTAEQVNQVRTGVARLRQQHPHVEIILVISDYFEEFPKPCMGGWGQRHITIDPTGVALPCPAARLIDTLSFPSVNQLSLRDIWFESTAFHAFRGKAWMLDPCRSCARQDIDHGGCRCQAFMYTGEARSTDPVCKFSGKRKDIDQFQLLKEDEPVALRTLTHQVGDAR
ncbi:MAG: pyrroloquinoline quinone biosynthesis protein PqqE [Candidatus Melainabacteria bacterium]|nr:MAG: pyrroloquinoline quinone biosynthesis protein PqqE [Candidatus Melainabacteria bacterium]